MYEYCYVSISECISTDMRLLISIGECISTTIMLFFYDLVFSCFGLQCFISDHLSSFQFIIVNRSKYQYAYKLLKIDIDIFIEFYIPLYLFIKLGRSFAWLIFCVPIILKALCIISVYSTRVNKIR